MKGFVKFETKTEVIKAMKTTALHALRVVEEVNISDLYSEGTFFTSRSYNDEKIKELNNIPYVICFRNGYGVTLFPAVENLETIINLAELNTEIHLGETLAITYNIFVANMKGE